LTAAAIVTLPPPAKNGLGDVILSIAFGGNAGCGVRLVI
jgi:hypothetical protein